MKTLVVLCVLATTTTIVWSKCSDPAKAHDCNECLLDPDCRYCPGPISQQGGCFGGACTDLGRHCVQKVEKKGRACHDSHGSTGLWLTNQLQCGRGVHGSKGQGKGEISGTEVAAVSARGKGEISGTEVAAVSARILKSGFVVTALLHVVGVSALSGPAAPFLLAAGAIAFLSYDIMEKIQQKSLKKEYELLMSAAQYFMKSLDGEDKSKPDGLVEALHILITLIKRIPEDDAKMKAVQEKVKEVKTLEGKITQSDEVAELRAHTKTLEDLVIKMKQQLDFVHKRLVEQRTRVRKVILLASEEAKRVICVAKDIGKQIFGEEFNKIMGIWSKVLAVVSVAVVGIDGVMNGAEMVSEIAEGGIETASVLAGDLPTAAIHLAEVREFFEEENEEDVRDRVARILCDLENRNMARDMENMIIESLNDAQVIVVPSSASSKRSRSRSETAICEGSSTKTVDSSEDSPFDRAMRKSEHSIQSHASFTEICELPRQDSLSSFLRGPSHTSSSASLEPSTDFRTLPVTSSRNIGEFTPGQSKKVVYDSGATSILTRRRNAGGNP